ncbi:MAG: hypothetical protein J2P55_13340, partial [Rhizobiales bacterium]|nr:hypothetical protein [Hyphomicrobiales bacterium]
MTSEDRARDRLHFPRQQFFSTAVSGDSAAHHIAKITISPISQKPICYTSPHARIIPSGCHKGKVMKQVDKLEANAAALKRWRSKLKRAMTAID